MWSGRQRAGRLVSHKFVNFDIQTCSDAELDTPHGDMGEAAGQDDCAAGQLNKRCGLNLQAVEPVRDDDAALVCPGSKSRGNPSATAKPNRPPIPDIPAISGH